MVIPGEEFELALGKYKDYDDKYILLTRINTGSINITLYENLDVYDDTEKFLL